VPHQQLSPMTSRGPPLLLRLTGVILSHVAATPCHACPPSVVCSRMCTVPLGPRAPFSSRHPLLLLSHMPEPDPSLSPFILCFSARELSVLRRSPLPCLASRPREKLHPEGPRRLLILRCTHFAHHHHQCALETIRLGQDLATVAA
jgi:hypothetical protein